ncbi:hypothetical protein V757_02790 [Pelistega indica]|uniref:Uncharacterized protein n=2 Tax=Pelistega indica TaxID=1414851 RepID=V8G9R6_9BURK|nr:hypothetical protein V757_02790 [Pelistega indica]
MNWLMLICTLLFGGFFVKRYGIFLLMASKDDKDRFISELRQLKSESNKIEFILKMNEWQKWKEQGHFNVELTEDLFVY